MPKRLAPLLVAVLALWGGCGDSSSEKAPAPTAPVGAAAKTCDARSPGIDALRATGVSCSQARRIVRGWRRERSCSLPSAASRTSCLSRSYRCLGARTDRGLAVSCARAGQSIAFTVRR